MPQPLFGVGLPRRMGIGEGRDRHAGVVDAHDPRIGVERAIEGLGWRHLGDEVDVRDRRSAARSSRALYRCTPVKASTAEGETGGLLQERSIPLDGSSDRLGGCRRSGRCQLSDAEMVRTALAVAAAPAMPEAAAHAVRKATAHAMGETVPAFMMLAAVAPVIR